MVERTTIGPLNDMKTPVALLIFNRPDTTERVFAEVARARPHKFFVVADGPRPDRPQDVEKCAAARAIIERVDWECDVFKNYSDVNLGCGRRPATGISWVFEQVEEAIILEDDCVPHPTFFRFCEELLERYRDHEKVMMIAGSNDWFGHGRTAYSYRFSRHVWNWGWATWRRAWQHYDIKIISWPEFRKTSWLRDILGHPSAVEYWQKIFDKAYAAQGKVDYWDYQWTFMCWAQNGLCIFPNTNVISNIGFGEDATHTKRATDVTNMPTTAIEFPLQHPPIVVQDREIDRFLVEQFIEHSIVKPTSLYRKLRRKASAAIHKLVREGVVRLESKRMF